MASKSWSEMVEEEEVEEGVMLARAPPILNLWNNVESTLGPMVSPNPIHHGI